jgi:hypothetical protein
MTWIRFSMDTRCIDQFGAESTNKIEDSISFTTCLSFYSAISRLMMIELMGSGNETEDYKTADDQIEAKVSSAYEKNQLRLAKVICSGHKPRPTFVAILLNALKENRAESLRFALKKWKLDGSDKKKLKEKLNDPLKGDDEEFAPRRSYNRWGSNDKAKGKKESPSEPKDNSAGFDGNTAKKVETKINPQRSYLEQFELLHTAPDHRIETAKAEADIPLTLENAISCLKWNNGCKKMRSTSDIILRGALDTYVHYSSKSRKVRQEVLDRATKALARAYLLGWRP